MIIRTVLDCLTILATVVLWSSILLLLSDSTSLWPSAPAKLALLAFISRELLRFIIALLPPPPPTPTPLRLHIKRVDDDSSPSPSSDLDHSALSPLPAPHHAPRDR